MIRFSKKLLRRLKLNIYKKRGAQISKDLRLTGDLTIGSEPYLVSIGKNVTISGGVTMHTHDGGSWIFRRNKRYKNLIRYGRVTINENCFVGHGSTIMPGVKIGPNSVIGAGSIVTKDVPPNTIVAGVPARIIYTKEEYLQKLLRDVPQYDEEIFKNNKKHMLLELYPYPW